MNDTIIPQQSLAVRSWTTRDLFALAVVFAITLALYFPARHFAFINLDDGAYVTDNYHITTGFTADNLAAAMTSVINGNWHPLTTLAFLIIASAAGVHAGAFHLVNAVLHAINAALFFWFLRRATGRLWPSIFAAALWAFHPQRVESVAWVSELKDVLCGTMWLACMLAYFYYSQNRNLRTYLPVVVFLVLAVLAKPMAVTLPVVFLLLDYWPLGPSLSTDRTPQWWRNRVLEKLPLFLVAGVDVAIGIVTQIRVRAGVPLAVFPMSIRLQNAGVSYLAYLRDTFWPTRLVIFYPHPAMVNGLDISWQAILGSATVMTLISILVCLLRKSRPYLLVGWFWFCGTLVPVLGLLQSGQQARADRFTYFPAMGIAIALVWLIADLVRAQPRLRFAVGTLSALLAAGLIWISAVDISYWKNATTLFTHVIQIQPNNYLAIGMLGDDLRATGHNDEALLLGARAVDLAAGDQGTRILYALQLRTAKKYEDAAQQLSNVLSGDPENYEALNMLGTVRSLQAGEALSAHLPTEQTFRRQAIYDFRQALKIKPDSVLAGENLAYELAAAGQLDQAIAVWKSVVGLMPTFSQAQGDLADALRLKQDLPGAEEHYRAALANGDKTPAWETQLAYLVATNPQSTISDVQPMVAVAKDACDQTKNRDAAALDAYAACLARVGRFDDAVATAQQAVAQANANHTPAVALGIQKHLSRYQRGLSYVAGDE